MELTRCPVSGGVFSTNMEEIKNCQQEFAKELGLAPSTVSHHFKELRQAGLLNMNREGKNVTVRVDSEMLAALRDLF